MAESKPERRSGKRIPARVAVTVKSGNLEASGYTRDLSSNGIFLYADAEIVPGSELEIVMVLPPELAQGERRWACCQGAVARVEPGSTGEGMGVAVTLKRMEILPEIEG